MWATLHSPCGVGADYGIIIARFCKFLRGIRANIVIARGVASWQSTNLKLQDSTESLKESAVFVEWLEYPCDSAVLFDSVESFADSVLPLKLLESFISFYGLLLSLRSLAKTVRGHKVALIPSLWICCSFGVVIQKRICRILPYRHCEAFWKNAVAIHLF